MDDVIEQIGRLNIEENEAPLIEQPGPSQNFRKWVTKTLESVHLDEVGNMGTRSSTRQDDGGYADNSNLSDVDYMDVSYDC